MQVLRCPCESQTITWMHWLTGDIWEGIYADDCLFVDPTVTFRGESSAILLCMLYRQHWHGRISTLLWVCPGLQKWRRNLQLLVPFLISPRIDMYSLERISPESPSGPVQLKVRVR